MEGDEAGAEPSGGTFRHIERGKALLDGQMGSVKQGVGE